jgi:LysW-gamma-L-lysine carboxypeptidase
MNRVPQPTGLDVPDEVIETLHGLVGHYSPTGSENGAVDWAVSRMAKLGYTRAFRDEAGNAVGMMGEGPRQLVLLGHIDTVPGNIDLRRDGDLLYGRGTVDAKGALASFVDAVSRIGAQPGWQFVVIGAVGEEGDSEGARFVANGYHPVYTVIGEPSGWDRITLGYKGSAWADVTLSRPLAHTSAAGASACEAAVALWQGISRWAEEYNRGRAKAFERAVPSLRGMTSGRRDFDEWARLQIATRLPADLGPEGWITALETICATADASVSPVGFAIPAFRADKNNALVRALVSSIRLQGGIPGFVLKTGTADMNIVAPVWGCPAVAYGPGDSALDHTSEEHISLTEYGRAVAVLEAALRSLVQPR